MLFQNFFLVLYTTYAEKNPPCGVISKRLKLGGGSWRLRRIEYRRIKLEIENLPPVG